MDEQVTVSKELLERTMRLLESFTENAKYCFGVDIYNLNKTMLDIEKII